MKEKTKIDEILLEFFTFVVVVVIVFGAYNFFKETNIKRNIEHEHPVVIKHCEKEMTMINDSTFHINLSDDICVTFHRSNDTLNIYAVGTSLIDYDLSKDDTIRICFPCKNDEYYNEWFNLNYHDYFEENVKLVLFNQK